MKLRTAVLVVLAGFAAIPTCRLLKMKIDRARRMAEWRAREATKPRPEYWPIDEPWPAKDGPIMVVFECPVPLTVRGTQALVSFAPLAFKLFCAARQNAVLRRPPFPPV